MLCWFLIEGNICSPQPIPVLNLQGQLTAKMLKQNNCKDFSSHTQERPCQPKTHLHTTLKLRSRMQSKLGMVVYTLMEPLDCYCLESEELDLEMVMEDLVLAQAQARARALVKVMVMVLELVMAPEWVMELAMAVVLESVKALG